MFIPPKRRRRIMRAHHLRQQGHSLRQIAEKLNISIATVRADLKLAQTHWATIAAASADDLLLESLHLLQIRLTLAIKRDYVADNASRLTPVDYLRARDAQETQLNHLAREIRRTAHDVHRRAAQRPDQPDLFDEEPQELAETITESTKIEPPNSTISSPEQEIVQS
ncbi:MAG: HTH domain-containing protein, partial [Chloroflexi bacterium]|nr:HTH domain-containing protein [Chloroflexota bacterium]